MRITEKRNVLIWCENLLPINAQRSALLEGMTVFLLYRAANTVPFRSIRYDLVTVTRLVDSAFRYSLWATVTSKKIW